MSAQDLRDVMGLTGHVARPPPLKKQKTVGQRALEKGIAREVSALMGERAPPISMIPIQPKYKQRPKRSHKAAPWILEPFGNKARDDALVLYHWARKQVAKPKSTDAPDSEHNTQTEGEDGKSQPAVVNDDYKFARYNVQVEVPTYTDELYNSQLQDPDWTKEETDYLVDLVRDFGQKWPVVVDRYDFRSTNSEDNMHAQPKDRSTEQLKHRYYTISAKILAHNTPISSMNAPQYNLYSTLQNFNPVQETSRKKLAEGHLYRSPAEVDEETVLLAELQRIMINQNLLESERKEIRDRLEFPQSNNNASNAQYSSSAALGTLFQQLLQADRLKKDRKFRNVPDAATNTTPSTAQASAQAGAAQASAHRDSIGAANPPGRKPGGGRDSLAGSGSDGVSRPLNQHAEQRYFVTHHDRLSSGVSFASDKLHKPRNAKSAIQTERIAAVLSHLQIPDVISVPTQKVIDEFEKLMQKVYLLLDMRKVAEKEEHEIRVKTAEKGIKGEKESGSGGGGNSGVVSVKEERRGSLVAQDGSAGAGAGAGAGASSLGVAGQKRSASVMSESAGGGGATGSGQQSSKRPKM